MNSPRGRLAWEAAPRHSMTWRSGTASRSGAHEPTAARLAILILVPILLAACRKQAPTDEVTGAVAFDQFDALCAYAQVSSFVSLGPRDSGTPGSELAASYLLSRLETLGFEPVLDSFEDDTPRGKVTFRNVMGIIEGTQRQTIILGSHYDTKSGISDRFCGANDSGSSTGLLLELGRCLKASGPLPADIVLAFFDGEECMQKYADNDGLHGSRHLASTLARNGKSKNVLAVIVIDMIGDRQLNVTVPRNSHPELVSHVFAAARDEGVRETFSLSRTDILDDHVPFLQRGMPAVDLIDFDFGAKPGQNDYWHTDADTMDKIGAESLDTVGRVVLRTVDRILFPPHTNK